MVCLSHSQAKFPVFIQNASISGAYAVTFVMVMFATCLAIAWRRWRNLNNWIVDIPSGQRGMNWPVALGVAIVLFVLNLGFGLICLNNAPRFKHQSKTENASTTPTLKVGLVQTNFDVVFVETPSMKDLDLRVAEVTKLTNRAAREHPDLLVWPESGLFPCRWQLEDRELQSAAESEGIIRSFWEQAVGSNRSGGTPLLSGVLVQNYPQKKVYNSAVLINHQGQLLKRYDKIHPVMFGEYVPFGKMFPFLEDMVPMTSIEFGQEFRAYEINDINIAPNICFESTIAHLSLIHI